jgi:glycosyltransferase involved in cell wall biosynthesis
MAIAFVFDAFPSPSETFLRREVDALRARGLDVRPLAFRAGEGALALPLAASLAARLIRRGRGQVWWQHRGRDWARGWKQNPPFEIEHLHAAWASFPAAWASGAAAELGVPWSFSGHARDVWVEGGDLPRKLGGCAFATACTRAGHGHLQQLAPHGARVLYAPHGLPLDEWPLRAPLANDPARPFQILSVGRLVPKKGFEILLRALANLEPGEGRLWQARIIGSGPERARLEAMRDKLKLQGRVFFDGAQSGAQVRAAMEQADAFVLPCRVARDGDRDGLPNVLLEAAAVGVPILAGDAGSVRDFCVPDGPDWNSALCAPDDPDALGYLLRDTGASIASREWQSAVARAREKVEREWDIARTVEVLARALEASVRNRQQ